MGRGGRLHHYEQKVETHHHMEMLHYASWAANQLLPEENLREERKLREHRHASWLRRTK